MTKRRTPRYLRGMYDAERMSPAQLERMGDALIIMEALAEEGVLTFAVVSDPQAVAPSGRKPRRDRKPVEADRLIGPIARRIHRELIAQGVAETVKVIADHLNLNPAVTRTNLHYLKNAGLADRRFTPECGREAVWFATKKSPDAVS